MSVGSWSWMLGDLNLIFTLHSYESKNENDDIEVRSLKAEAMEDSLKQMERIPTDDVFSVFCNGGDVEVGEAFLASHEAF